jgi:uncharacterized membrane protein
MRKGLIAALEALRHKKRCATQNASWAQEFPVTIRKYFVLAGVTVFAPAGDSMLSYGMKQVGRVSPSHLQSVVAAVLNPWVAVGILLLLLFVIFNMTALSWADLTYVLPATSFGYVLVALIARFALHEHITPLRWIGIALIAGGVGFVAGGPALTVPECPEQPAECEDEAVIAAAATGAKS